MTRIRTSKAAKLAACITALMTLVSMTAVPCFAKDAQTGITKDETVYVVTDADGTANDIIVSDHLKNANHLDTINDETDLTDIENVKGDEKFKQSGGRLDWEADGADIYYQGKTEKAVPVRMSVKYYLDGTQVSGGDLKDADGHLRIVIKYDSTAKSGGTTVPFIAMTGFLVKDECFKDIKVSSGKVIDDGDKQIVVAMAAPGLSDSLNLSDADLGFSDEVTIEGQADKFAVEDMMTYATNNLFEDIDAGDIGDLDFDDQIDQLNSGALQLVNGSKELYEGIDYLNSKTGTLAEGVDKLAGGSKELNQGIDEFTSTITEKMNTMKDGVQQLTGVSGKIYSGIDSLKAGAQKLAANTTEDSQLVQGVDGVRQYVDGVLNKTLIGENKGIELANGAADTASKVSAGLDGLKAAVSSMGLPEEQAAQLISTIDTLKGAAEGAKQQAGGAAQYAQGAVNALQTSEGDMNLNVIIAGIKGGIAQINSGANDMISGIGSKDVPGETLLYGAYALNSGLKTLNTELGNSTAPEGSLAKGVKQLTGGASQLADGLGQLNEKTGPLIDGIGKIDTGAFKLSAGMLQLYKEGIAKIVSLYNDDLKGLVGGVDDLVNAGESYKTFSTLPKGMDGSVKFIFKTAITE